MAMRSGLFLPLFDELADPAVVARLSVEAEQADWDGVFVWDHVRRHEPVLAVADPWITLAAVAAATRRVRLGPMVTPLARAAAQPYDVVAALPPGREQQRADGDQPVASQGEGEAHGRNWVPGRDPQAARRADRGAEFW
jgi:alkanesulfonate monooxygenase SsuD/methylene tetrahydromethanopterin reductase-like flavin-dependent oxidoreductase (luciferase family)